MDSFSLITSHCSFDSIKLMINKFNILNTRIFLQIKFDPATKGKRSVQRYRVNFS